MGTVIVGALLVLTIGAVIRKMIKDKASGKCHCGCESCSSSCHSIKDK
ncbi:FeoB-associated Cys-rich membrane protein [Cellulosilyticum ruminicola]|nr:FeoB-associated Cys-rich membrane protein [Cellulosilyticum ruminicola]